MITVSFEPPPPIEEGRYRVFATLRQPRNGGNTFLKVGFTRNGFPTGREGEQFDNETIKDAFLRLLNELREEVKKTFSKCVDEIMIMLNLITRYEQEVIRVTS